MNAFIELIRPVPGAEYIPSPFEQMSGEQYEKWHVQWNERLLKASEEELPALNEEKEKMEKHGFSDGKMHELFYISNNEFLKHRWAASGRRQRRYFDKLKKRAVLVDTVLRGSEYVVIFDRIGLYAFDTELGVEMIRGRYRGREDVFYSFNEKGNMRMLKKIFRTCAMCNPGFVELLDFLKNEYLDGDIVEVRLYQSNIEYM